MQLKHIKILRILTILLSVSLVIVSVAGAFLPGSYARDSASLGAQGVGQDLVNLFVAVPVLLLTFYHTARGRRVASLLYGGTLFYIMYSFIIYCFGIFFNHLFLLYCLTLSLSLFAFILFFSDMMFQKIEGWFTGAPVGAISVYILVVALIFYVLWLSSIIPAIIQNELPRDVADNNLLVSPVHVIDLVFALPGLIIGALLIRKKRGPGYLITSIALVFMVLLTLALAAMVVSLVVKGINEDFTVAIVFAVLSITSVVFSFLLFRSVIPSSIAKKDINE
jgi:hypothetical protein